MQIRNWFKKNVLIGLASGMLLSMAAIQGIAGTDALEFNIRITVNADHIEIQVPEYCGFDRTIEFGNNTISAIACGMKNVGNTNIKLTMSAEFNPSPDPKKRDWVQNEEKPGDPLAEGEYRLAGIFTNKLRKVSAADFNADDIFCQAGRECTSTAYAYDDEVDPDPNPITNNPDKFRGFNIPPDKWRDLYFYVEIPEVEDEEARKALKGEFLVTITVLAEKNI